MLYKGFAASQVGCYEEIRGKEFEGERGSVVIGVYCCVQGKPNDKCMLIRALLCCVLFGAVVKWNRRQHEHHGHGNVTIREACVLAL